MRSAIVSSFGAVRSHLLPSLPPPPSALSSVYKTTPSAVLSPDVALELCNHPGVQAGLEAHFLAEWQTETRIEFLCQSPCGL